MSMVLHISSYDVNKTFVNDIIDASKIKKNWFGKVTDNYWEYIAEAHIELKSNLDPYIIGDFFTYLSEDLQFKEGLREISNTLSENRNSFIIDLQKPDMDEIMRIVNNLNFHEEFIEFCKDLNEEYYNYTNDSIRQNIAELMSIFDKTNNDFGLYIHIG